MSAESLAQMIFQKTNAAKSQGYSVPSDTSRLSQHAKPSPYKNDGKRRRRSIFKPLEKGNNSFGRGGKLRCKRCRFLRQRCEFTDVASPCALCSKLGISCGTDDKVWGKERQVDRNSTRTRNDAIDADVPTKLLPRPHGSAMIIRRPPGPPDDAVLNSSESIYIGYYWEKMFTHNTTRRNCSSIHVLQRFGMTISSHAVRNAVIAHTCRVKDRRFEWDDLETLQYLNLSYKATRDAISRNAYIEVAYACFFIFCCYFDAKISNKDTFFEMMKHARGFLISLRHLKAPSLEPDEILLMKCMWQSVMNCSIFKIALGFVEHSVEAPECFQSFQDATSLVQLELLIESQCVPDADGVLQLQDRLRELQVCLDTWHLLNGDPLTVTDGELLFGEPLSIVIQRKLLRISFSLLQKDWFNPRIAFGQQPTGFQYLHRFSIDWVFIAYNTFLLDHSLRGFALDAAVAISKALTPFTPLPSTALWLLFLLSLFLHQTQPNAVDINVRRRVSQAFKATAESIAPSAQSGLPLILQFYNEARSRSGRELITFKVNDIGIFDCLHYVTSFCSLPRLGFEEFKQNTSKFFYSAESTADTEQIVEVERTG